MAEIRWSSALEFSLKGGVLAGVPQFVQKLMFCESGRPQEAQLTTEMGLPQLVQNRAPLSAADPQFEQDNVAEDMAIPIRDFVALPMKCCILS